MLPRLRQRVPRTGLTVVSSTHGDAQHRVAHRRAAASPRRRAGSGLRWVGYDRPGATAGVHPGVPDRPVGYGRPRDVATVVARAGRSHAVRPVSGAGTPAGWPADDGARLAAARAAGRHGCVDREVSASGPAPYGAIGSRLGSPGWPTRPHSTAGGWQVAAATGGLRRLAESPGRARLHRGRRGGAGGGVVLVHRRWCVRRSASGPARRWSDDDLALARPWGPDPARRSGRPTLFLHGGGDRMITLVARGAGSRRRSRAPR